MALYNNLVTPPGVNIRTDYSPTYNYAIPLMQVDCWPVNLTPAHLQPWQQVVIVAQQNEFWAQQQGILHAWLSVNPNGINVLPQSYGSRSVRLQGMGVSWCFYADTLDLALVKPAAISFALNPNQIGDGGNPGFFFNIQNMSGEEGAYYLQFQYYGHGGTLIQ